MKLTTEHIRTINAWREEVVDSIQAALAGYTSMTSEQDLEAAEGIFQVLSRDGYLDLPDLDPGALEATMGPGE